MISRRKKVLSFVVTALALVVLFLFAVNTGSLKVTPGELFRGLFVAYDKNVATIYDLRFPRIFIALLGGAATAVSGVLLQAVMKNPLADPGIIGVSSGASLAAVLVTAFVPSLYFVTPLFAFLGGMLASNYDVKTVFIDAFLKLIKIDLADAKWFFDSLEKYAQKHDVTFVLSVSADPEALPDFCKGYII